MLIVSAGLLRSTCQPVACDQPADFALDLRRRGEPFVGAPDADANDGVCLSPRSARIASASC